MRNMAIIACAASMLALAAISAAPAGPPDRPDPLVNALAMTTEQQADYHHWLATQGPHPAPDAIANDLLSRLDPARAALASALIQCGGRPTIIQIFTRPLFLDTTADQKNFSVESGQLLAITLPANRDTGRRWFVDPIPDDIVQPLGTEQYVQTPIADAPATFARAFIADTPGTAVIQLRYARPRDREHPDRTIRFTVEVKKPAPLIARLTNRRPTYTLPAELKNKTAEQLARGQQPMPPTVDMALRIINRYDKSITLMSGSDHEMILMDLQGPGAVTVAANIAMTKEMRLGKPFTLKPGQWYTLPIKRMAFGLRGVSKIAYWTRPGDYTLTVRYQGVVDPAGEKKFILRAPPIHIKITSPAP